MNTRGGRPFNVSSPAPWLVALLQVLFILLYSSGFIVGRIATDAASPFAIVFWRFILAGGLLALVAVAMRAPWPRTWREWRDIAITGLLLQTVHYAGTYVGFEHGISASLSAMVLGMMPLLVAIGAFFVLQERMSRWQVVGTFLGFAGLLLTTAFGLTGGDTIAAALYTGIGCLGLAGGTLYQRKTGMQMDLRSGGALQLWVGAVGMLPVALLHEGLAIPFTAPALFSLGWLSTFNSLGAITLLLWFLRHQSAGEASSLFYLMPSVTAIAAWPLLGQPIHWYTIAGLVLTGIGLLLVTRYSPSRARRDVNTAIAEGQS